ncbi:MAG: preprotein translocase subunit YajC [Clostridia bacterium]|nr:preprotein translocase subunit YajC [Clostridia bacterium]
MLVTTFLPMILIFVVFYFMLIRPQRKKDKKVKEMLDNLKVSDRVCTIGGIYGTITQIRDDTVTLSVGNQNMTMVIARWGIRSVEEVSVENDMEALN